MRTHELLSHEVVSLAGLGDADVEFLKRISTEATEGADYFDLLRRVKGPGAVPLRGSAITPAVARSVLYRVAHDIADRVGVAQGYVLAPDVDRSTAIAPNADLLSLTEAAELIGISRAAAHQALGEDRLRGKRVGNAWVVRRADAETFKAGRSTRPGGSSFTGVTEGALAAGRDPNR